MRTMFAIVSLLFYTGVAVASGYLVAGPTVDFCQPSPENYSFAFHSTALTVGLVPVGLGVLKFIKHDLPLVGYAGEFTVGICEKVQSSLNDILKSKSTEIKRTAVGYTQAVTSPQNTAGVSQVPVDPGNGKKKQVRITYIQRGTEDDVVETQNTDCSTEIEKTPLEETVDVTSYIRTKGMKFDENEMRKLCEPDSAWMARIVNAEIDALVRVLNKRLIAQQALNFGINTSTGVSTAKSVEMTKNNGEYAKYMGEAEIFEDLEDMDINDRPIFIGAGNMRRYARLAKVGCCNSGGIDLSRAGDFDYYTDRFLGPIIGGTNDFAVLIPGYVQLLTWNKYVGTYKKENDVFSHSTILDPVSGINFDMKWHYNDCDDSFSLFFGLWYDMWFLPADAFAAGDELNGVNYTFHYEATDDFGDSYI